MLPNFLIIGAQKAASSWLARCLNQHPDAFVPEQELHFFNHRFSNGVEWYESHFREWSGQAHVGEKSPGYLNHPEAPGRIHATLGSETRLIASLRHPVDRAYSAFWQFVKRGRIPPDSDFRTYFRENDRIELYDRGCYYTHLSRYLEFFSRQNLLIFIFEELRKDNQKAIAQCTDFLGLDTALPDGSLFVPTKVDAKINRGRELRRFHSQAESLRQSVANAATHLPKRIREPIMDAGRTAFEHLILRRLPKQRDYDLLDKGVRQELLDDFMPEIRQLEDLLGRDLAIWYAPEPLGRAEPEPAANPVAHMQPTGSVHVPVQVPTDSAAQTGTGA